MTEDAPAQGLTEVLARRFLTTDAARPEKVARWHAKGRRTARENIADLVDAGSFVEYGRFVTAAQEGRRPLAELVVEAPADGIIGGTATVDGLPCAVLSYDYLVMAGTQGMRGHRKSDRLIELAARMRLPAVFFTEGGGGRPGDVDLPLVSALDVGSFALWGEAHRAPDRRRVRPLLRRQRRDRGLRRPSDSHPRRQPRHGRAGHDRGRRARAVRARGHRAGGGPGHQRRARRGRRGRGRRRRGRTTPARSPRAARPRRRGYRGPGGAADPAAGERARGVRRAPGGRGARGHGLGAVAAGGLGARAW
ncbi:carboxyl transferase domain-containing protein [Nocardioides convexus]|uniref:carboxyl transferase domain-containing protein n=1 Tax=Nocardioides convexus TaxID=2712224 RepID=UPI0024183780|nr:carboxyl transferase domain-containing protein [Nocardioides convexus]